ncbi:MAG: hypothetical protein JWP44_1545 [Mucilaginibacter sp.]|nr:hypothetical protein [Mucilaginibacter sp.]
MEIFLLIVVLKFNLYMALCFYGTISPLNKDFIPY